MKIDHTNELNDLDQEAIAELIIDGFTSGRLDDEGRYISWELKTTIWSDDQE